MRRKEALMIGEVYHTFNKSIAGFKVFNDEGDLLRIKNSFRYYQRANISMKFAQFLESKEVQREGFDKCFTRIFSNHEKIVQIIAYCIMPTHLHLILKQLKENGISAFMGNLLNSYSRYFNTRRKRKGPLWVGRFKNVLVKTDEQLLHLTRYIHLNPVTAFLVDKPEGWNASSYSEYMFDLEPEKKICEFEDLLDINPLRYRQFVSDRISYQRELAKIKDLLFE